MQPMPNRSSLLRFPEGTLIDRKYVLISPCGRERAGPSAPAAGGADGEAAGDDDPPSRLAPSSYAVPLGWGGSSVVFLAQQVVFDPGGRPRSVPRAIKFYLLSPTLARGSDRRRLQAANAQTMRNELNHLTSVQHPNILKVIDAGVCARRGAALNYLVTEYVPGPTLSEVIACGAANQRVRRRTGRGELVHRQLCQNPALIVRILDQLCAALAHLHEQSIYHCDVAPKNIFIHPGAGCRPILADFALGWQPHRPQCLDRIPLGGAMRYAPPSHRQLLAAAGTREFARHAAYWDIYGFAKSALELAGLAPAGSTSPWQQALMRCLREALAEENGVTAAKLHRRIATLL